MHAIICPFTGFTGGKIEIRSRDEIGPRAAGEHNPVGFDRAAAGRQSSDFAAAADERSSVAIFMDGDIAGEQRGAQSLTNRAIIHLGVVQENKELLPDPGIIVVRVPAIRRDPAISLNGCSGAASAAPELSFWASTREPVSRYETMTPLSLSSVAAKDGQASLA